MANNPSSSVHKPTSETLSRCVTDGVTTTHNFKVIGYLLLEGMGAGEFVTSSTLSIGDYDWNIMIYPDGMEEEDKASYVSVFLAVCGGATGVRVKYTFSLLEKDEGVSNLCSSTRTFEPLASSWGWSKFIEKSKLQELLSRSDDSFTVRCVLTVIKKTHIEGASSVKVKVPESNLCTHFANMFEDGEGVDVTFSVGGQLFGAHRYVLATRSSVLKAE
ncbi:hypothetical protein QYE76_046981 [Lolium multiflorum]|uniref:Uncharacterized protein n=1 Tax=Lolium multiflorum TaxID=4521 RepID=A0AAD8X1J6_LOLMU|nr:hypothetical protein QYE76_046981 [Lolium multiflorum]